MMQAAGDMQTAYEKRAKEHIRAGQYCTCRTEARWCWTWGELASKTCSSRSASHTSSRVACIQFGPGLNMLYISGGSELSSGKLSSGEVRFQFPTHILLCAAVSLFCEHRSSTGGVGACICHLPCFANTHKVHIMLVGH